MPSHQRRMVQVWAHGNPAFARVDMERPHCTRPSRQSVLRVFWQMIAMMGLLLPTLACAVRSGSRTCHRHAPLALQDYHDPCVLDIGEG